ncbi:MAG: hypothetical protein ACTSR3_16615 [Candidatus Helarchaeota archaeon]
MPISEETRIFNYVINVFREEGLFEKGVIEYKIDIPGGGISNPDFFCFLMRAPDFNNYYLLEIKQRSNIYSSDIETFRNQYHKFGLIECNLLDETKIPVIENVPIYTNYLFYDTPIDVIETIRSEIDFNENTAFLHYSTRDTNSRNITYNFEPNSPLNHQLNDYLIQYSQTREFWSNRLIPFTKIDLEGIRGTGGSPSDVRIDPKVSFSILLSKICVFILQRKIQDKPSEFHIDEFFNFIFRNISNLLFIDDDEKKSIIRKIRLFLNLVSKVSKDENFTFFEKKDVELNRYSISIKRTETLASRIERFRSKLNKIIEDLIRQKKLDDFF